MTTIDTPVAAAATIHPFRCSVAQEELDALRGRLAVGSSLRRHFSPHDATDPLVGDIRQSFRALR